MEFNVKQELLELSSSSSSSSSGSSDIEEFVNDTFLESLKSKFMEKQARRKNTRNSNGVIEEGEVVEDEEDIRLLLKKPKVEGSDDVVFPHRFLASLPPLEPNALPLTEAFPVSVRVPGDVQSSPVVRGCKQFWKAGDYEGGESGNSASNSVGMDHVRVHPKFLHSNATSHKWALGAFAELLDNSLDEVCNGATYVHIDMLNNQKDNTKMLVVEDNGGGMIPDKMRQCMSLGYSSKSKIANTIGQYGNGFKTSTMRLGADVIVFSRCQGNDGRSFTQSIGMLSYTFLRGTGKEDIVVPMIDYEKRGQGWYKLTRSTPNDWNRNLATIVQWSPYVSEEDLLQQFNFLKDHGTRVVIYNLWEDDEGSLELDFDTDLHDIQIRGVNRDEKNIQMAEEYPNSRHFLTYRHSLRSYASILYLRLPPNFRIILRGKDVEHHNIVNDMMSTKEITYRPQHLPERMPKDSNTVAVVTLGFVKDARFHIDIQGFNVYHKNRLIKPFWRVWNAAGSDGRGVIGVLEANFIEPAHDKQGFERTIVLSRLEQRLLVMQKNYWSSKCQEIGYAPRRRPVGSPDKESFNKEKSTSRTNQNGHASSDQKKNGHASICGVSKPKSSVKSDKRSPSVGIASEDGSCYDASPSCGESEQDPSSDGRTDQMLKRSHSKTPTTSTIGDEQASPDGLSESLVELKEENRKSRKRLKELGGPNAVKLLNDLQYERDRSKSLEDQLQEAQQKVEELDKEQLTLIDMILEERGRRDALEENMRKSLRNASDTIAELLEKVKQVEDRKV